MLERKHVAKDFHFNHKEIDAHVNFHFSGTFLSLKEHTQLHTEARRA